MKGKSKGKSKSFIALLGVIAAVGVALGCTIYFVMNQYLEMQPVYTVKAEIDEHAVLSADMFLRTNLPKKAIPSNAIQTDEQFSKILGKRARTLLVPGQILQEANVSTANTIREINQNISEDYVTVTMPVDSSDVPIEIIHPNDVVSLVGVSKDQSTGKEVIISKFIAENVLVLQAMRDEKAGNNKLIVLVPRKEAAQLQGTIVAGKVRVVLDPHKFKLK